MLTEPIAIHALGLLAENGGGGSLGGLMPILLMFAVVYFIVLRPMSKQEKERKKRIEGIKKGDQVVVGGGILGRVSNLDDPKIAVVEIADKVKIRVLKKDIVDLQAKALEDPREAKAKPAKDDDKAKTAEKSA
jgi:preprotein translocase subunit YajC